MRRARFLLVAGAAAVVALGAGAPPAQAVPKIAQQQPTKGTVGSKIHVEGAGCPPPAAGGAAGTFIISNGTGVLFEFTASVDGKFAFDYPVPPAEAGEQKTDSIYETKLFCASANRTITGASFEITGPEFTLRPAKAPPGATVQVVGMGCVQDGGGADDGFVIVNGEPLTTFKTTDRFRFRATFRVPNLPSDLRYLVQVNCLIQRLESAAGAGGQRAVVPALLYIEPGPTATTTTTPPVEEESGDSPALLVLAAVVTTLVLAAVVITIRRRRRPMSGPPVGPPVDDPFDEVDVEPGREAEPEAEPEPEPVVAFHDRSRPREVRPRRRPLRASVDNGGVPLEPPFADRHHHELVAFGDVRVDPFYWLRERDNPETISYLEAENAYADELLEPLHRLRQTLFDTIKARTKEDDTTAAVPLRAWEYYARTAEGAQYADSCRRPRGANEDGEESVLIDRNAMAEGHEYLSCVGPRVSPDDTLGLYATDFDGSEKYTIRVRNLDTLQDLPDTIPDTSGGMCWVNEDVFLYVMLDEAHRPYQVRRHVLGDDPAYDDVIYEDNDERFFVRVVRDLAGRFVFVQSGSKISNEDHFLRVDNPLGQLTVIEPRVDGLEYETADDGERFVILTNADGAADFKVVTAPVGSPRRTNWKDLLPHRPGTRITEVALFKSFMAVGERGDALTTIRIINRVNGAQHVMQHQEAVYAAAIDANAEFDTTTLRFTFTSLNTPVTWIDYNVVSRQSTLVKQTEVLGGFTPSDYITAREWATADDGTRIPISIIHRRDFVRDGTAPCLLYGYGSYELSIDPTFSVARLNLVDRGVVFAIAHIRGGGEMGREWYETGKMLRKRNTFTDFIACARHLIQAGWCAPGKLAARGGSAGGLLMGAVANMAPELFNTVVAEVPFVNVVTTMSDETIPLTVTEWEEWGNPRDNADDYQYMKSYSPYDNVTEMDYPAIYVEAGLNDPRVQYWEPAKWVAKLRVTKTDDRPLVLKTDMGAGHGGPSGRYRAWEDEARVQAFVLNQLGISR